MDNILHLLVSCIVLFGVSVDSISVAGDQQEGNGTQIDKVGSTIFCYFASYSYSHKGIDKFDVEDIDPFACTHYAYAFARLDKTKYTIIPNDPHHDLDYGDAAFKRFIGLKKWNPDLKILLTIGGWGDGSLQYSQMVTDPKKRKNFVASVVDMLTTYGFDGLDFDWEYPGGREGKGGLPTDKENFVILLRELKAAFEEHRSIFGGSRLLLTAAVTCGGWSVDKAYDVVGLSNVLDFINLMTYNFHSAWSRSNTLTGHHSPLFALPEEKNPSHPGHNRNSDFTVRNWIKHGAKPSQILMGMSSYGRGYTLADPKQHGFYAKATGDIAPALSTSSKGAWTFSEYCQRMKSEQSEWTIYRDPDAKVPYTVNGNSWLGFDDVESVRIKSEYIKNMGLGGAVMWSIDQDDFNGICGEKFGLLKSIAKVLHGTA